MQKTTPRSVSLITAPCFLGLLLCTGLFSAEQVTAQDPGWSPVIFPTGEYRNQIKSLPIEQRPYRPLHFYGNSVRRNYYRSTQNAQFSERQAARIQSYRPSISPPRTYSPRTYTPNASGYGASINNAPVQPIRPQSWSSNSYTPQSYPAVPRVSYPDYSNPTAPATHRSIPYQYAPVQSWRGPAW